MSIFKRKIIRSVFAATFCILLSQPASAALLDVAILGSPNGGDPWNDDVAQKLNATGFFNTIDIFRIDQVTPNLATMQNYDSVLVYSDGRGYNNAAALGDALADYVDAGGGVVMAVFAVASIPLSGRFHDDNYYALQPLLQTQGVQLTLGNVNDPAHATMHGVNFFDGGSSSYRGTGSPHPDALVIAEWSNGAPLVIERLGLAAPRIDLNFFPPSDAERADFWNENTDGGLLMGNSLCYVARGVCQVSESNTLALAGIGILGLVLIRRRRRAV